MNLVAEIASGQEGAKLRCVIGTKAFELSCFKGGRNWEIDPVVIAGPATVTLKSGGVGKGASSVS